MSLALVRHGRTQWNEARLMQGRTDVPLDEEGRTQAADAGRTLLAFSDRAWRRVVSSPLLRAAESAQIIATELGLEVEIDPALIERDYGAAEGLPVGEVQERWPGGDYPGAEPLADVVERSAAALRAYSAEGGVIVVAHGTFLRVGIEAITGAAFPRLVNGQVVVLEGSSVV